MSGGVDSTVAVMLAARSTEAVAVTLELWADHENDAERSCCSSSGRPGARDRALDRCSALHARPAPGVQAGCRRPFIAGYRLGETPNPCVKCNGHVRLDAMLEFADRVGASTLATGHYARTADHNAAAGPLLRQAADEGKDQTYMLAALARSRSHGSGSRSESC